MQLSNLFKDLPEPDLDTFSFCGHTAAALGDWVSGLPMANTDEAADKLSTAISELTRLKIGPVQRIELLEMLRPPLLYVCTRFDTSPKGHEHLEMEPAYTAQNLQEELAGSYKIVIRDILKQSESAEENVAELLGLSIHRVISDLSRTILRACQFYTEALPQIWSELHQLYQLALEKELAEQQYADDENHSVRLTSITAAYIRILLLVTSRPNQLRYRHLTALFHGLEVWTSYVSLIPPGEDSLFLVDPNGNSPPQYRRLIDNVKAHSLDLKTDVLVFELEAYLNELDTQIEVPEYLPEELLGHVIRAWGIMKKRAFKRAPAEGEVKICVGLRVIHYYITGGVEFAEQLGSTEALLRREINPFSETFAGTGPAPTSADVWGSNAIIPTNPNVMDPDRMLVSETKTVERRHHDPEKYPCFDTQIIDSSPNGYQLCRPDGLPPNLQTGELLAIRDNLDDRWCLAVARWIRHVDYTAYIGVELLSPRAVPMAIRVVMKKGGPTDYSRALLLPALEVIGQPAMLITPLIPFQESQKIHIQRQGIQTTAQLMRRIRITESFSQFTFRMLDGYLENAEINMNITSIGDN